MSITRAAFDEIVEADFDKLVESAVREGLLIEFKRDMYGGADDEKREFLKDVSSFANSSGGHLIIGMTEAEGIAVAKSPIEGDSDQHLLRLESLVQSVLEPRIVGIRMRAVPAAAGGHIFVLRVPKSWNPPHRVTFKGTNRFYARSSAGAHEVSVEELRAIFGSGASLNDRIVAFRRERLARIDVNDGIFPLAQALGRLVVHIAPFSAFGSGIQIDLGEARGVKGNLVPMGAEGWTDSFNFDGFAVKRTGEQCYGYTHVFRNGIIEATKVRILGDVRQRVVFAYRDFGEDLFAHFPQYMNALERLAVSPPFIIMITLQGMRNAVIPLPGMFGGDSPPAGRDVLELPPQQIDGFGDIASYQRALGPALDALWNAFGEEDAEAFMESFDAHGRWMRRQ